MRGPAHSIAVRYERRAGRARPAIQAEEAAGKVECSSSYQNPAAANGAGGDSTPPIGGEALCCSSRRFRILLEGQHHKREESVILPKTRMMKGFTDPLPSADMRLQALVLVLAGCALIAVGCNVDEDCNLNGLCTAGSCTCNAGRPGPLAPPHASTLFIPVLSPPPPLDHHESTPTALWCIRRARPVIIATAGPPRIHTDG